MSGIPDFEWWEFEENREAIIAQPNCGGGLAVYTNPRGEIVFRQSDYHADQDDFVIFTPHLARVVVQRLLELVPELAEAPPPLPLALLPAPRPRASVPTPPAPTGGLFDSAREAAE